MVFTVAAEREREREWGRKRCRRIQFPASATHWHPSATIFSPIPMLSNSPSIADPFLSVPRLTLSLTLLFCLVAEKIQIQIQILPLFFADSASSTFVQSLNRRVSSATTDLDLLDSMSFGTVSFEELLGHCNELYKKNQTDLSELEDRLKCYGYVPGTTSSSRSRSTSICKQFFCSRSLDWEFLFLALVADVEEEEEGDEVEDRQNQVSECRLDSLSSFHGSLSVPDSSFKSFDEDALYPYTNLGFCLDEILKLY